MLVFLGKVILLYILTIAIIRLMGKSVFTQLTAHDLAGIFLVVIIAGGPLSTENLSYSIAGLIVVGVIHITLSKLTLINQLHNFFIGKPTIVIKHGKLIKANLKRSHFTLSGLLSSIREKGYSDIAVIDYGVIEPSGEVSVLPKKEVAPVSPRQLKIETTYEGLPIVVIIEGEIQHENLKIINKDEKWLKKELTKAGYPNQNDIFYVSVHDKDDLLTIDTGDGGFQERETGNNSN